MLKIGDFSKLSRVSIRMLRHYDELGLLTPAMTASATGYRYYAEEQLRAAGKIAALRDMGVGLAAIGEILRSGEDPACLELHLRQHRQALERELSFGEGIRSDLVTTILDRIVVKKESTKEEIHLDIFLKLGAKFEAVFPSASINRARNITPRLRIRRT